MHQMSPEMQSCIQNCQNCHAVCLGMASTHCLEIGGKHVESQHFRLMLDCAEICQTAANFMLRNSTMHQRICAGCAEICEACAQSCQTLEGMEDCVEACRRCSESCRQMAYAA